MVLKTFVLLAAATGLGAALFRMNTRLPQRAAPGESPTPTFGDRFRRMDLHTSGLGSSDDEHEDLLTPPKP